MLAWKDKIPNLWSKHKLCTTHFLSGPLRLKLNHFFFADMSFESELLSSPRLSDMHSSPGILLPLPLLKCPLSLVLPTDLTTVKDEWTLSRCFRSSSTCLWTWVNTTGKYLPTKKAGSGMTGFIKREEYSYKLGNAL